MSRRVLPIVLLLFAARIAAGQITAPTSAPALQSIPTPAAQSAAQDLLHKLYKTDFEKTSPADRRNFAKFLITQAKETKDDPAARFVALADAIDLAAGAGDAATAFLAIDQRANVYPTDTLDLRQLALLKAQAAASPEQSEAVMRLALDTGDQAAALDAFDRVPALIALAEAAANKTRQVSIVTSIQVHLSDLRDLVAQFAQLKPAFARLEQNPADADAHLAVGRFYALSKGQWALGLPHLAQGSDEKLRDLATRELAHPEDGLAQTALGDAWWDYAQSSTGLVRTNATAHASDLYKIALTTIKGITLARIQSRIQNPATQPAANATLAPVPSKINLLTLIDPSKDTAQGNWSRTAAGLSCESSAYAALHIPFSTPEEFDLATSFTRTAGEGPVAILLATHNRNFGFVLDVKGEARFERVESKIAKDNPTVVPVALSNNRRYTLTIQIRKDRVRALLDDKLLTEWKTDYKDLSHYSVWKINENSVSAIGANNAKVTFHTIDLIEITGKGKPTRTP